MKASKTPLSLYLYSANDKNSTRILIRLKGFYAVSRLWGNNTLKFGIKGVEKCQITIVKGSSKRHNRNVFFFRELAFCQLPMVKLNGQVRVPFELDSNFTSFSASASGSNMDTTCDDLSQRKSRPLIYRLDIITSKISSLDNATFNNLPLLFSFSSMHALRKF